MKERLLRSSPPVPREEALARLFAALGPKFSPATEAFATASALGRTLAADVLSPSDVPPFTRSSMDGFALRASDTQGDAESKSLRIVAQLAMGEASSRPLESGEAAAIPTGGMLPLGADSVVPIEEAELSGDAVRVASAVKPGQHVTERGADVQQGGRLLSSGRRLHPADLAALTAAGVHRVIVARAPQVAIIPTGDELVPADRTPQPGQIREFNSVSLAASATRDGAEANVFAIVGDDPDVQRRVLADGMGKADLVLVIGGSSVGGRDFTTEVMGKFPGPGVIVQGVAMRPGRPAILAVLSDKAGRLVPVFGIPGHPVSAIVVYETLVRPTIDQLLGRNREPRPTVRSLVLDRHPAASVEFFARVGLLPRDGDPPWEARSLRGDSAILTTLVRSGGILRLPAGGGCEPGEVRDVELWI